ncbi:MAG: esterase family protein [Anaerolineales bacterium]|nr:esterase family protein [Anaerolineales bacterium]
MKNWRGWFLVGLAALLPACVPAAAGAPVETGFAAAETSATGAPTASALPAAARASPTALPAPSAILVPSATPPPTPALAASIAATPCAEARGWVRRLAAPSPRLGYDIDAQIYLPPCYASSGERYPVLYLIHGLGFTEDQWVRLGAPETADALIAAGEIAPLIIVMPRDRIDTGLDPAFVTDLVPYLDANYRTLADGPHRAIGGLSRGGGWAIHLGLRYPKVFGRVGGHSPAVFLGDENNVLEYARAIARAGPAPALYVDVGEDDGQRQSAIWLDQVFTWFDFEHTYRLQPGGHTEQYWSRNMADYLRFYAADWRAGREPWRAPATPESR